MCPELSFGLGIPLRCPHIPHQNGKYSESRSCAKGMLDVVEGKGDRRREIGAKEREGRKEN
jgi:uncharacterized protein YbbK (DUF523 family)